MTGNGFRIAALSAGICGLMLACGGGESNLPDVLTPDVLEDASQDPGHDTGHCPVDPPRDPVDTQQTKFALTLFHWNIQYVAGGLIAELGGRSVTLCELFFGEGTEEMCAGWDDETLNDWIIQESFEPILDMYLAHPDWKTTFEIPGYMIEEIEARHPLVLEKLLVGAERGQIELSALHWAVQLFLAFPSRDLDRSVEINREIYDRTCLPLSGTVFNQEGQSGLGKHRFMARSGYDIDVIHENMLLFVQQGNVAWPWYESEGVTVVTGMRPGHVDPESGIEVAWPFFDDGEILSTPGGPYLAPISVADPGKVAEYEARLTNLANQGFKLTHIGDFVAQMEGRGMERKPLPAIGDSTWQPIDTRGISLWMGRRGGLGYSSYERDNLMRTWSYRIGQKLAALEVLAEVAEADGKTHPNDFDSRLRTAWKHLLMAEISDTTGINPWPGEWEFGANHNRDAEAIVDALTTELKEILEWPYAWINVGEGTAEKMDDLPMPEPPPETDPPFDVTVSAPTRVVEVRWYQMSGDRVEMHLTFGPMADPTSEDAPSRVVSATFPRHADALIYTPGLDEDRVVTQPFESFNFQDGRTYLPLANGLIGLGDDWWLIKHCTHVHLAAEVGATAEDRQIRFIDETAPRDAGETWLFSVIQGTEADALALARRINTHPSLLR
jgi:hypothetical protein